MLLFLRNLWAFALITTLLAPAGYLVLSLLLRPRSGDTLPSAFEGLALAIPAGLLSVLVCNLVLAAGHATLPRFLLLYAPFFLGGLLLFVRDLRRREGPAPGPPAASRSDHWLTIGTAMLILIFIWQTRIPNRFLGGADTGSYTSTIYGFYARGGIEATNPMLAEFAGEDGIDSAAFAPISHQITDAPRGRLSPSFPAGFALMAAPFYELFRSRINDLDAIYILYQFCGLWSLLLIVALANRLGGPGAGFLAALFLSGNWLQLWLSRSAYNEVPLQTLSLAIIFAVVLAIKVPAPRVFPVAAVLTAALFPIKVEGLLLLPALWLALPLLAVSRRTRLAWFLLTLLATLAVALPYLAAHDAILKSYLFHNLKGVRPLVTLFPGVFGG